MNTPLLAMLLALTTAANADSIKGDAAAGQAKSTTCAACHGVDGNSTIGEWPKLAGQHEQYTRRQLELFKNGGRENAVMLGMVVALSEQDMADLAAYYSEQKGQPGVADEAYIDLGQQVYRAGDAVEGTPACIACHGPTGKGNPASGYPAIGGQHAQYTAIVLKAFRDGTVWGKGEAANTVMSEVAAELSDQEIEAVASYLEGLH